MQEKKLRKEITLLSAVLYGTGVILGAGIYVLIGQGAALAGNMLWLSFLIAAAIAAFTGFSYAELVSMFPRNAAEYVYTKNAFNSKSLAFVVQWIMVVTMIISAATVALGFGGYMNFLLGVSPSASAVALIILVSAINYRGIKESTRFNDISSIIEILGLVLVALVGVLFLGKSHVDFFYSPSGTQGIFSAIALIFFAYIGFEEVVNLSEDTKKAKTIIPKALLISLFVSTLLYILVSVSSLSILGAERLGASKAPLADVVSAVLPGGGILLSLIALFATSNTVLVIILVASRMVYGLAGSGSLPSVLGKVGRRGTPDFALATVAVVSLLSLLLGNIRTVALLTDIGIFLVYVSVNASLIALRYKKPDASRPFRSPVNIGNFPVLAFFGLLTSGYMLTHFTAEIVLLQFGVIVAGFVIYKTFIKTREFERKIYAGMFRKSVFTISRSELFTKSLTYPAKVSSIMVTNVKTASPEHDTKKIAAVMKRHKLGSMIVVKNNRPVGIVTERDIMKVVAKNKLPSRVFVKHIMSTRLVIVKPSDSVLYAIKLMAKNNIKKLPVVENNRLVGIVTESDIIKSGEKIEYKTMKKLAK
ncbi:MAG: amino acid permease [Candidatus Aenigmatarchaeota archaeon]